MTIDDQMILRVDGEVVEADEGALLGEVLKRGAYRKGSIVAVIRSPETVRAETNEYEITTPKGKMVLRLNDSAFAEAFSRSRGEVAGKGIRWKTSKVLAVGAFPTEVKVDRDEHHYTRYDCFLALGGFDNRTTYLMIARTDHDGRYGTNGGVIGRVTRGRHVLEKLEESDRLLEIVPIVLEVSEKNAFVTEDMGLALEEGMSIESFVGVKLNRKSPVSSEHLLVVTEKGTLRVTDATSTYAACSSRMDVSLVAEEVAVREEGRVTVRHEGAGTGRIYLHRTRRQLSSSHNHVGDVNAGMELIRLAPEGSTVTLVPDPMRIMTIGMTQAEGNRFLEERGLSQVRKGEVSDDSIIVEQEPELTMEALGTGEVETFGVKGSEVSEIELLDSLSPRTSHYIRKMTGLDHKPVGTMKVHFIFEGMPMVTFEGNPREAADLVPEGTFEEQSLRGEIGVTNMSRPNRGLIGIRLDASDEFGPTGEERYGTNLAGRLITPIERLVADLKEGDVIYLREGRRTKTAKRKRGVKRARGD